MKFDLVGSVVKIEAKTTTSNKPFSVLTVQEPHSFKQSMSTFELAVFGQAQAQLHGLETGTPVVIRGTIDSEPTDRGFLRTSFKAEQVITLDALLGGRQDRARDIPRAPAVAPAPAYRPQGAQPRQQAPEPANDAPLPF